MKNFLFALVLSFICLISTSFAQEKTAGKQYEFKGIVKDKNSAVFTGIPLFFIGNGKEDFVSTDINGEFSIKLSPGNYEVTVRKTLSETFKAYIFIQENGLNPTNVEFVIEPNSFCCRELSENDYPKIIKSLKPKYPPAGVAVRAVGEVVVKVDIDKEGKVISANAVSGHPLLKTASVEAAKQSLFEATESDAPRNAKITYVFLQSYGEKENIKRYSNPYRIEILSPKVEIQY